MIRYLPDPLRRRRPSRAASAIFGMIGLTLPGWTGTAHAQPVNLPARAAPGVAVGYGATGSAYTPVDGEHPMPVGGKQEAFALLVANQPSIAATVYGGDYVFAQACGGYGTVTLRVRGPDGATMQPILTRAAIDPDGGTGVTLGSGAVVDAVISGATGCNATLSRVP